MKNTKKSVLNLLILLAFGFLMVGFSSCKTGEGCPGSDYELGSEIDSFNGKRGKSGLYSKKERKRMGK
jgi:hypothetical protein